jgi:catechol 2,3-dioxygenase-like lactoylglutathione lyase family enzyme
MPQIQGVLETGLYVADLERTRRFYADLFHFPILSEDNRFCAFDVAGRNVLILFQQGASLAPIRLQGGAIPTHDGSGPVHLAFSISKQEYGEWQARLSANALQSKARSSGR